MELELLGHGGLWRTGMQRLVNEFMQKLEAEEASDVETSTET